MKTKIKWFKEVLDLEPGSKVFFPLARLQFEEGRAQEAVNTLRGGLERNPDHLEAKLLLVEILSASDGDEARRQVESITTMLGRYPAFWRVWAQESAPRSKDSALALSFLAAHFQGATVSWSEVIEKGIVALFDTPASAGTSMDAAGSDEDPDEGHDEEPNLRTRTMADLLVEQGDYQGALDIYRELADSAPESEADELAGLIESMQGKLGQAAGGASVPDVTVDFGIEDDPDEAGTDDDGVLGSPLPGKEKMLSTLEALAARLEARAGQ